MTTVDATAGTVAAADGTAAAAGPRARAAGRGRRGTLLALLPVGTQSALAGLAFAPVFGGYHQAGPVGRFELLVIGAAMVPVVLSGAATAGNRLGNGRRSAAAAAGLIAYALLVAAPGRAVLDGPHRLLTTTLPVQASGPELATVLLIVGAAALAGTELVLGGRSALVPALPPLTCAATALALGASAGPPARWLGPAFALAALAELALSRRAPAARLPGAPRQPAAPGGKAKRARARRAGANRHRRRDSAGPRLAGAEHGERPRPARIRRALVTVAAAGAAAALGLLFTPVVPFLPEGAGPNGPAGGPAVRPRLDAQSFFTQNVSPRATVSPLVEFPALAAGREAGPTLIIRSEQPVELLRAVTLPDFDGVHWTTSAAYRRADQRLPPPPERVPYREQEISVHVENANALAWLPTVGRPLALSVGGLGVDESTGDVVVPSDRPAPGSYSALGAVPAVDQAQLTVDAPTPAPLRPTYTLPAAVRAAATQAAATARTPLGRVEAIRDLFLRDGGFRYDTSAQPPGGHGVYQIGQLIANHRGTAEQFASAFAVMVRELGYQARIVLGYRVPAGDRRTGDYRATGRDVHAWAEVLFDEAGWVAFDPSPRDQQSTGEIDAAERSAGQVPPAADPAGGQQAPVAAGDSGTAGATGASRPKTSGDGSPGRTAARGGVSSVVVAGAVLAAAGALAIGAVPAVKGVRGRHRRSRPGTTAQIAGAHREMVDQLRDAGLPVRPTHTGGELAAVVERHRSPRVAAPVAELVAVHEHAVFAPTPGAAPSPDPAWVLVAVLRRELRTGLPWYRRLAARLSPASLRPW